MIPSLPEPATSRAILIGTSRYTELPDLPGVEHNLTDLAEVLGSPMGTGLPAEHVVVLANPATQSVAGDHIKRAANEATGLLLVYYSGHGLMTWDRVNELYLSLPDTRSETVRTSGLRSADVRQYILDSPAATRVLILDCCYGGRSIEPTMANPAEAMLAKVDIEGAYVLAATHDEALAPADLRNTLFTGELLRLIREGVATEPGMLLSLDALYREVKAAMERRNLPAPRCNASGTAAHLAIAANPAHQAHRLLAGLHAELDRLADQEAETNLVYAKTIDRIARPNLPPVEVAAPGLRERLAALDPAANGGKPPPADALAELHDALTEALDATLRLRELAAGPLDWRDQLRAKLDGYQVEAVTRGIAEDAEIAGKYRVARDLVWTKPCPLGAATRAINAYQQAVIDRRERRG